MKRALYLGLMIVLLAAVGWRWRTGKDHRAVAKVKVPTAEVTRGSLVVTLPIGGALESGLETPARSEIEGVLIFLCEDNSYVNPGDVVYRLDTKALAEEREKLVSALADAEDELANELADAEVSIAQAKSEVTGAEEDLKLAKEQAQAEREKIAAEVKHVEGETERAQREFQRYRRLAKLNYIAGTQLREAEKDFRRQQFEMDQKRAEQQDVEKRTTEQVQDKETALALARHSLNTTLADAKVHAEQERADVAEAERRLEEQDKKISQCTVTASAAGMAVIETNTDNWPERRPYRLGDNVRSGSAPVRIYDFRKMQVRCQIGEMDISRVRQGQEAYVLTPAGGGRRYRAKVALVEELAQESNVWQGGTPGKKVFGVLVSLLENDPLRLRPGMTVDLEIVLDTVRKATMIPIRAAFTEGEERTVYVAQNQGFTRVPVTVGTRNDLLIEVSGKLQVGDRVALERPPEKAVFKVGGKR